MAILRLTHGRACKRRPMIRGRVTVGKAMLIACEIMDNRSRLWPLEAYLDTGFTGDLALPINAIRRLGLPHLGERIFTLADGRTNAMNTYYGTLIWHERPRDVVVIQTDGAPLIGMGLLWGNQIILNAVDGGSVIIEEIVSA